MISVIVPSRLQVLPHSPERNLYLDVCLIRIHQQQGVSMDDLEVVVGLDPGALPKVPQRFLEHGAGYPKIRFVEAAKPGQAQAVNAAAAASTGHILAFCEDDDQWAGVRLTRGLESLAGHDFVSCNQREVNDEGEFLRVNDFPTPSGWIMPRATWDAVGPLEESFRYHVDTEWLGRLNDRKLSRVHQVDPDARRRLEDPACWLHNVRKFSDIAVLKAPEPLVTRVVNPRGGMSTIARDPEAQRQSGEEHAQMLNAFGEVPW